tara:strand:- start:1555 stop:1722 length:168 start_codon:yes stop_codon:yes gene_type:complete
MSEIRWPEMIELTVFGDPEVLDFKMALPNGKAIYTTGDDQDVTCVRVGETITEEK